MLPRSPVDYNFGRAPGLPPSWSVCPEVRLIVIDGRGSCAERWHARCLVHELAVMSSSALRRAAVGQPVALLAILAIDTPVVMEVSSLDLVPAASLLDLLLWNARVLAQ